MLHSRTMVKFMVRPERPLSSTHDTHDTAPRRATAYTEVHDTIHAAHTRTPPHDTYSETQVYL